LIFPQTILLCVLEVPIQDACGRGVSSMKSGIYVVIILWALAVPVLMPSVVMPVHLNVAPNQSEFVASMMSEISESLGFILTEEDYMKLVEAQEDQSLNPKVSQSVDLALLSSDTDWVDVSFLYDDDARNLFNSHFPHGMDPIEVCEDIVYGLNLVYNQYSKTDDLEFYFEHNYCEYDADGPRGYTPWDDPYVTSSMDVWVFMHTWALQKKWPHASGVTWQSYGRIAPPGIYVHGSRWDLLIMMSGENLLAQGSPSFLGATWRCDNRLLLKVPNISRWGPSGENDDGFTIGIPGFYCMPGAWTVAAHEVGHDYGIYGDTGGTRFDLMDYFWAWSKPWSYSLDDGHQSDVYPWTYIHSW